MGSLRSKYFGVGGVSRNFGVGCVGGLDQKTFGLGRHFAAGQKMVSV